MENQENIILINKRRLAYRIGDKLPKPIRVIYYIILAITLVYWLYRFSKFILDLIQKIGSFAFEKRNYYTFIICLIILGIGILLASQFIFGLNPFGKSLNWVVDKYNDLKNLIINLLE